MKTATIAIGGNAILRSGEKGTLEEQMRNVRQTAKVIADLVEEEYDLVLTHGNGPQVGNVLLQNETAKDSVPQLPLDVLVAETQGWIGYMLQQGLSAELAIRGIIGMNVVTIITRVVVNPNDPAFNDPTKPIGPYYKQDEARLLMAVKGWKMVKDEMRGGWRRLVPSPDPKDIVEKDSIRRLVFTGGRSNYIVIAAGGGGIPVIPTPDGYVGVEAVVDKDLAASVLASSVEEKLFVMLTDVPCVYVNFRTPDKAPLGQVSLDEMKRYYEDGQFPPGSMGPKVLASIKFLESGGEEAVITSPEELKGALTRGRGTHIHR
jgi:carbamate kinase